MKSGFKEQQQGVRALGGDDLGKVKVDAGDTAGYLGDKLIAGSNVTLTEGAGDITISANVASVSGHQIEGEGVQVPLQPALNFVGGGVTVTDDAVGNKTTVRIKGLKVSEPIATATLTCEEGWHYVCNGVTTANLPDGVQGMVIGFADYGNTFTANPLTINAFTGDVIGIPETTTLTLDRDSSTVVLGFSSGRWILLSAETFNDLGVASGAGGGTADFPPQSGNSGKFLFTDGTDVSWQTVDALPSQSGQSGKILSTNGTVASWVDAPTNGADGDSAYQVAVTNGFVGDEIAWLASLVGATGAAGADGATGATGSVSAATGLTLEHIATPSAPASGNTIIYGKSDGKIYKRPAGGSEEEIGSGGSGVVADNVFRIQDNGDATKQVAFETSGITTGTTRTLTVPDANGTVSIAGTLTDKALYYWDTTSKLMKPIAIGTTDQVLVAKPSLDPPYQFATASSGGREVLAASRTYYVRTDGSDSNTGLTNTSGGAFLTIQKFYDTVGSIDKNGFNISCQVVDGTYNITSAIVAKSGIGDGSINIIGNNSTPANVNIVITADLTDSKGAFSFDGQANIHTLSGIKISCPSFSTQRAIHARFGSIVYYGAMDFGAFLGTFSNHIRVDNSSLVVCSADYTISGRAGCHVFATTQGSVEIISRTITLSGTPAFDGSGFIASTRCSTVLVYANTYSGSATGKRYDANANGIILSLGDTYPGNAGGTVATGGQFIT